MLWFRIPVGKSLETFQKEVNVLSVEKSDE